MSRSPCRGRGVTLVEMLVVVTLVALVVSLAAPSIRELLAVQRLQSIHAALVTDLQYARSEAVNRRRSLIVDINTDANQSCYVIYAEGFGSGNCNCQRPHGQVCTGSFEEIRSARFARSSNVSLSASSSQSTVATFERDTGYSSPGDLRIDLVSDVRGSLRVTIGATGRISSCTPDGSVRQVARC